MSSQTHREHGWQKLSQLEVSEKRELEPGRAPGYVEVYKEKTLNCPGATVSFFLTDYWIGKHFFLVEVVWRDVGCYGPSCMLALINGSHCRLGGQQPTKDSSVSSLQFPLSFSDLWSNPITRHRGSKQHTLSPHLPQMHTQIPMINCIFPMHIHSGSCYCHYFSLVFWPICLTDSKNKKSGVTVCVLNEIIFKPKRTARNQGGQCMMMTGMSWAGICEL